MNRKITIKYDFIKFKRAINGFFFITIVQFDDFNTILATQYIHLSLPVYYSNKKKSAEYRKFRYCLLFAMQKSSTYIVIFMDDSFCNRHFHIIDIKQS